MANCHDEFQDYISELDLRPGQEEKLTDSRDALRRRISNHLSAKGLRQPLFRGQGSFPLGTQNRPIDGEFDLDDGVYLQHYTDDDEPSVQQVFELITKAVTNHTSEPLDVKDTCVRVVYKRPSEGTPAHHIDEAIYREKSEGTKFYAHRIKGWLASDQPGFISTFYQTLKVHGEQFRRDIRYFKGWTDYQRSTPKLPSGFHLTVLVMECFVRADNRDDTSFVETAAAMQDRFYAAYIQGTALPVRRPVAPFEDIFGDYDLVRKLHFLKKLKDLVQRGSSALHGTNHRESCQTWRNLVGDRFSLPEESARTWDAPAILGASGRSG